jgi:hypothetical protein
MGLFDIFKKKETPEAQPESKTLLAMPMFNNGEQYSLNSVLENLKNFWGLNVTDLQGDDNTAVFRINGEMVAIAYMPAQIPWGDIEGTAQYAYNWQTAVQDLKEHNGHAIVSMMSGSKRAVDRYRIFSKVLCAILSTSNAIGVYQGSQTLLIPKDQYLDFAEELKNDGVPIPLWLYIGLRGSQTGNSIYTYGLSGFGKQEIEVVDSKLKLEELYGFIMNICAYVVGSDVTLRNGETLGYTNDQKIKITSSKGKFIEGESLKLEM